MTYLSQANDVFLSNPQDGDVLGYSAALRAWGNRTPGVPAPTANALTYGADPLGKVDSTAAIQAAINALPATGGVVYIPAGDYKINGTINIGNGSASGISSRSGVVLQGACPMGLLPIYIGVPPKRTRLFSGGTGPMIQINGPLNGWGVRDMHLDGNGVGNNGLWEISACAGDSRNVYISNFLVAGQQMTSLSATGALAGYPANHMHNSYLNWCINIAASPFAKALYIGAAADGTTNCCYDAWIDLYILFPSADTNSYYGIYLLSPDNMSFRNVHMTNTVPSGGGHRYGVLYDYTGPIPQLPGDCLVDLVDFGSASCEFFNSGSPLGQLNRIRNISMCNAIPSNPLLVGLEWEGVRTKAGAPVAGDIPVGESAVFRDTTNSTTKLYYNNGGVLMSVALA